MYDPFAEFTKHVLPNGLEVHTQYLERPWIAVEIVIHSGSREDPLKLPGLAHFVEHLVTQNIPQYEFDQVREFFDTCGGKVGFGTTYYLCTRYKFIVPNDPAIFCKALSIFGSMLFGAKIKKEIERERKVILREFNNSYPFAEKLEWDLDARKALFRGHRLETWNRPLGRPEGFLSITETDLQNFYDEAYVPANTSLVLIGGLPSHEMITEIEKSPFGMQKNGTRNPIPKSFNRFSFPTDHGKTVRISDYASFKIDQTEYTATWAFPSDFPLQARRVFGQTLGQILFEEIREKRGLAYSIGVDYTNFQDVYEFVVKGRISPAATPDINDLVRECISSVPLRHDLFERKLRACFQRCHMIDLSGSDLTNNSAEELATYHRIISMQETWDKLQKVRHEQMSAATAFLSPERQYTFITCP